MKKKVTVTAVVLAAVLALGGCGAMTAMQPTESGETQQSQVSAGNDVSTASSQDPSSASISIAASQAEPEQPEVANGVSSAPEEGSWPTPQGFATPEEVVHAFAKAYLAKIPIPSFPCMPKSLWSILAVYMIARRTNGAIKCLPLGTLPLPLLTLDYRV